MEIEAIQELIKNDEETRQRIAVQYEKRHKLKQALEAEKKRLTLQAQTAVRSQVDATRKQLDEQIKKEAENNRLYLAEASAELRALYDKNKERWRQELFDRVVKEKRETA